MKVCLYAATHDTTAQRVEFFDFRALARWLEGNYREGAKEDATLWAPTELYEGSTNRSEVAQISASMLDLDDVELLDLQRVILPALEQEGLEFVLHSTHKNWLARIKERVRARIIIPYLSPIEPAEWRDIQRRLGALLGISIAKPKQNQGGNDIGFVSRSAYLWSGPPGGQDAAFFVYRQGRPLDTKSLLERNRARLTRTRATVTNLLALAMRLKRSVKSERCQYGRALENLARGQSFAVVGDRDDTTYWLAGAIARECDGADEREIIEVFRASVNAMAGEIEALTMDVVEDKVHRLCEGRESSATDQTDEIRGRWQQCLERSGRHEVYTEDELEDFATRIRIDRSGLSSAWILQKTGWYWVLTQTGYLGPYSSTELPELAEVALAPANSDGVQVQIWIRKRIARKSPADLVAEYGRVISEVVRDMSLQEPFLSRSGKGWTLYLAPCPLRDIQPRRNLEVEKWLELLGGESLDSLLDWIARVAALSEPSPALWLEGATGAGKGLLAVGLARLWTEDHPTDLEDALRNFNDQIGQCPLILGDERIPTDFRGQPRVQDLKTLISAASRRFEVKNQPVATIRGCVRVILATNNTSLFALGNELTPDDIDALLERLVHIHVSREPRDYLTTLGGFDGIGQKWLETNAIAAHALHLRDTRQVRRGRFAIEVASNSRIRGIATSSGLRAAICHWLVLWLTSARASASGLIAVREGRLEVSARGLHEQWSQLDVSWGRTPNVSKLADTLRALGRECVDRETNGYTVRFRIIDPGNLSQWAEDKGFATRTDIERELARTVITPSAKVYPIEILARSR